MDIEENINAGSLFIESNVNTPPSSLRSLYGGAMHCMLPTDAVDVSELREVPDHQEVFCHKTTDQSIMVDILQYQSEYQGELAPKHHFSDIAEANAAEKQCEILSIEPVDKSCIALTECRDAWLLKGTQRVSKFNEQAGAENTIRIYMGLFRLPQFETDLLVTMNNPVNISIESSSRELATSSGENLDSWTIASFKNLLCSLKILDISLFG